MNRNRHAWCALLVRAALAVLIPAVGGLSTGFAQTNGAPPTNRPAPEPRASAPAGEPKPETVRPEIGKLLQAVDELITAKKFQEALVRLREADAIANRTPYETYAIERTRGVAAISAGDMPTAVKSFEAVVESGRSPPADQVNLVGVLAVTYFRMEDYPKSAAWASRYAGDGGTDPQLLELRAKALYLANDFAGAATESRALLDADEKTGAVPPLERLRLLASCYVKMNDGAGYGFVLEKLLVYYPSKEYWGEAIRRVETRPGFADYLALDALRLREATGSLSSAAQYMAMAQLALKAGFPAEAKRVVEKGFASGALGTGADAEAQKRLRDTAAKQAADDERLLAQNARDAGAAKDGTPLVSVGFAMVSAGQFDKGLALMEQGMQKGAATRREEAKLHLGVAYLAAGDRAKAIATFGTVQGGDGAGELARLWLIHVQRKSS